MNDMKVDFKRAVLIPSGAVNPNADWSALNKMGVYAGIGGSDRGFNEVGDVLTQLADGTPLDALWAEYQRSVQLQNASRQRIIDFLTFGVTKVVEQVPQAGSGGDFEVATEYGEPVGVRTKPTYFNMSYDFEWYDMAARFTWLFLLEADRAQADAVNAAALEADNRNIFNKVMRTVFNPSNLTTSIQGNAYNVYKFYNADGVVPPTYKTNVFAGSHTHYVGSNAATIDSGDLEAIQDDLYKHGYTKTLGYRLVLMVNKAQGDAIRTWRLNETNANSAVAKFDFIPARGREDMVFSATQQIVGTQVADSLSGLDVIGTYGDFIIVQEDYIPAGYLFAFATGGENNLNNPVGIREHENPAARGLRLVKGRTPDYPIIDSFYQRGFGTGIRQRAGGYVMQIVASTSYTPPSIYA